MQGVSRASLDAVLEQCLQLGPEVPAGAKSAKQPPAPGERAEQLLAAATLLSREPALRNVLTDTSTRASARSHLAHQVFDGKLRPEIVELIAQAAGAHWSRSRDFADAIEIAGASLAFYAAEHAGSIDTVEEELFRFARIVEANTALRAHLDDSQLPADQRSALLHTLLEGKATPITVALLDHLLRNDRGRRFTSGIAHFSELAHQRREELIAQVRVAAPLDPEHQQRLAQALGRLYQQPRVRLEVAVDPRVLGGMVVQVGNEVFDGSITGRLDSIRRKLVS